MVSALYYERRRQTAERASERDLRDAAEMHRRIYQAVRSRDAEAARLAMNEHLVQASRHQAQEPADQPGASPPASQTLSQASTAQDGPASGPSTRLRAGPSTRSEQACPSGSRGRVQPEGDVRTDGLAV